VLLRHLLLLTAVGTLGLSPVGLTIAQDYNVIATVNGAGITRDRLQTRVDSSLEKSGLNYGGITRPQQYKQMQRQALDLLIAEELLWQTAEQEGYVAESDEVDLAFAEVRRDFPSENALAAHLKRNAHTVESFREDLLRRISIRNWAHEALGSTIEISDAQVHEFYVANEVRFVQEEVINARHILIKVPADADEATTQKALERIEQIRTQALDGADFAELARNYSDGPSAADGGELGFAPRGVFVKPFEDAAFALEPGEISGITRTGYGFHIIELIDRREGHILPEQEVATAIRQQLFEDRLLEAMAAEVSNLREQASIEILIPL
jgi:parvulin-like peptidyl-prolyl isomerase